MAQPTHILAIDQGTTSTRTIVFDVTVSDGLVDKTVQATVYVQDDSPEVSADAGEVIVGDYDDVEDNYDPEDGAPDVPLSVDESLLDVDATASYANVFTAMFGGDGPDGNDVATAISYDFLVAEGASNLAKSIAFG